MTGPELKLTLSRLGITQARLARALRTSPQSVFNWITDRHPMPPTVQIIVVLLRDEAVTIEQIEQL